MSSIVFNLTTDELKPIVENAIGQPIVSLYATIEHQLLGHRGYSADKVIPTLRYSTASGQTGAVDVFVKWYRQPGPREAHCYTFLEKHEAPIPRMYGSLVKEGREMLFLEYLRPIGGLDAYNAFLEYPERFLKFLSTIARFNAIHPAGNASPHLLQNHCNPNWWWRTALGSLENIWQKAHEDSLGEEIKRFCLSSLSLLPKLQNLVHDLKEQVDLLPKGLVHSDFGPDQVGWRETSGELLIIDLEQVGYLPRFSDVGPWLGAPEDIQPYCLPRFQLARHYLDEYTRWGERAISVAHFLFECRIMWLCKTVTMLFFSLGRAIDGQVDWTNDPEEGRCAFRKDLLTSLENLAEQVK